MKIDGSFFRTYLDYINPRHDYKDNHDAVKSY
jgi:hypothetical protein